MSATLVTRLNQEIERLLNQPELKQKFFEFGVEPVGGPPEQFASIIKSEMTRWGKVIRDVDIRGQE